MGSLVGFEGCADLAECAERNRLVPLRAARSATGSCHYGLCGAQPARATTGCAELNRLAPLRTVRPCARLPETSGRAASVVFRTTSRGRRRTPG
jgi:hypothetical protein